MLLDQIFGALFQEFELLPTLARRQPVISKSKLQGAPSVEAALDIARLALEAETA